MLQFAEAMKTGSLIRRKIRMIIAGALFAGLAAQPWLFLSPAGAQTQPASRFDQGLLWKVEKAGAPASHVFGTIHIDDERVTKLPEAVTRSLSASSSFTMEVSLDPGNLLQLATRMIFQDGRDLPGVVGEALYQKVVAVSASLGMPGELLRQFKPWAVALLLSVPQQNSTDVLDLALFRMASEQNKTIHQLESIEEQVATFEALPESDQAALLSHALENHDKMPQMTKQVIEAYLRRDLAAMWRLSEEGDGGKPEYKRLNEVFTKRLLDERNTRMIERMQPQLRAGNAFIAVGALHLYGERGLLNLLAQRGYQLTRVY